MIHENATHRYRTIVHRPVSLAASMPYFLLSSQPGVNKEAREECRRGPRKPPHSPKSPTRVLAPGARGYTATKRSGSRSGRSGQPTAHAGDYLAPGGRHLAPICDACARSLAQECKAESQRAGAAIVATISAMIFATIVAMISAFGALRRIAEADIPIRPGSAWRCAPHRAAAIHCPLSL